MNPHNHQPDAVALIAGNGRLTLLTAEGMRAAGRRVHAIGLSGQYVAELPALCDSFREVGVLQLGRWKRVLRGYRDRHGVREAVMIGGVSKHKLMYRPMKLWRQLPDWRTLELWYRRLRHDRRDQAIMAAVADELAGIGVELVSNTTYLHEHVATPGRMTRRGPGPSQLADIAFGWPILLEMSRLDVGQSIAVKDRDIIAVEAQEGTDGMIARVGALCRGGGWVLLKGCHDGKDLRFDVPTIGEGTVAAVKAAGGAGIAVTPGRAIFADRRAVLDAADRSGLFVYGVETNAEPDGMG